MKSNNCTPLLIANKLQSHPHRDCFITLVVIFFITTSCSGGMGDVDAHPSPSAIGGLLLQAHQVATPADSDDVWVLEHHECKSANESWQLLYRGKQRQITRDQVTVELTQRYALWFDRRANGRSEREWWCIPRQRYCSEPIAFNTWNGKFSAGDRVNFPIVDLAPAHQALEAFIFETFERRCKVTGEEQPAYAVQSSITPAASATDAFPPTLRTDIADLIRRRHYQRPATITAATCCADAQTLKRYLRTLDPYSRYLSPEQAAFMDSRQEESVNLGLTLLAFDNRLLAVPLPNGPTQYAGLSEPAWLHTINDQSVAIDTLPSYQFLQFAPGSSVKIVTERHDGRFQIHNVIATHYRPEYIDYQQQTDSTLVRIYNFADRDERQLRGFLRRANDRGKRLILDLRFCPGGSLYAAADAVSLFLPAHLPVTTLFTVDEHRHVLKTLSGQLEMNVPIVIWVSALTASAAEIFVRALSHYQPAITVAGAPTAGKCLAQQQFPLTGGGRLELSVYGLQDSTGRFCEGQPFIPQTRLSAPGLF